ncbi:MAG: hypothetical protein KDI07_12115 [Anaerolineae bacterium]|nr:hypothetical protein [Anaerolineae bacterium]MCB9130082.1 hypothetical protein [Anaerolineales bacterium]MCB0232109.1 hypothetical protein [Anaerolineae bacterium]MCB0235997.1 hypothetical protein [Anaerolineae bacterium]MCB0246881.1 hypothetical protein [Anaerolineae bacterium]
MTPDFRDRISIAVWGVVLTMAGTALVSLPIQGDSISLVGRTFQLPLPASTLAPLLVALLAGSGTEAVIRAHPLAMQGRLRLTIRFWALPVSVAMISLVLLPRAPSEPYWAAGLLLATLLLSLVLTALYFSLDYESPGYRRARAFLNLVCYAIALMLFLLIPDSWSEVGRALILGGVAALLAMELLRGSRSNTGDILLYAFVTGAVVAQVAWALLLTGLSALSAGLLLLLLFYLLIGVTWQTLLGRLTRRVLLEFGMVGFAGLALVLILAK